MEKLSGTVIGKMTSFEFNINIKENVLRDLPIEKAQRVLFESMLKMEELAVNKAPQDQGELKEKIKLTPTNLENEYILESKAKHSEALEFGTRPFYAPIKPLKEWAARKTGDEDLGYAVQKKIAKKGITAQPFMRPAIREVENFWFQKFANEERVRD